MSLVKYPRTFHVPWSESATSDDVWHKSPFSLFNGKEVVVTEKMDGENCTMYRDAIHARSVDSKHHPSRSFVKQIQAAVGPQIPDSWRICGENLYAYHSVLYVGLPSYFLAFSMFDGNTCLSWDETVAWCEELGLDTVPVLYRGIWNEDAIKNLPKKSTYETFEAVDPNKKDIVFPDDFKPCDAEGYVIRIVESFDYADFIQSTAKWVRANHVKGNVFWMDRKPFPNILR